MLTSKENDAIEAYKATGSQRKAAKYLGISRRTFRERLDSANHKINNAPVGFKTTKITEQRDKSGNVTSSSVQFKLAPDGNENDTSSMKMIKNSIYRGADGSVVGQWEIYKEKDVTDAMYEALRTAFINHDLRATPVPKNAIYRHNDCVDVYLATDEHVNMRVFGDAQNSDDYGLEQAELDICESFRTLVGRTMTSNKAVLFNLGDNFHQNDFMNVTPASKNPLDSDKSFRDACDAVVRINIFKINLLLEEYSEVEVIGVDGNHDRDPMYWLFKCLEIYYSNEHRVKIKFDRTGCAGYKFGQNFIMIHHGDKINKPDQAAGILFDRYGAQAGGCKFKFIHCGHVHHDREVNTIGNVKFRTHETIAPKDWYAFSNGYTSGRSMKSYVYDETEGEIANYKVNL